MSAFRLVVQLVLCACLAVLVRGQDTTSACYDPNVAADGAWVSDVGYWDINGFQSTYSSSFSVLCAYRGYYLSGPAGINVLQWGPWHGNPNDTNCAPEPYTSQWSTTTERGRPGYGSFGTRTNAFSGGKILTHIRIGGWCNGAPENDICAGVCPGTDSYEDDLAVLKQDPSYMIMYYGDSAPLEPGNANYVITTTNSTQRSDGVTSRSSPIRTAPVSAITSVQLCYGLEAVVCPSR